MYKVHRTVAHRRRKYTRFYLLLSAFICFAMRFAHRCAGVPPHNAHAIAIFEVRSRRCSWFACECLANHATISSICSSLTDPDANRRAVFMPVPGTRLLPSSLYAARLDCGNDRLYSNARLAINCMLRGTLYCAIYPPKCVRLYMQIVTQTVGYR